MKKSRRKSEKRNLIKSIVKNIRKIAKNLAKTTKNIVLIICLILHIVDSSKNKFSNPYNIQNQSEIDITFKETQVLNSGIQDISY